MLRTLERILSMYPLGAFCCAVFQVGICEDVSSADILPKQVWKLSELCSPAETSVDSAFYSPTDLRIAYPPAGLYLPISSPSEADSLKFISSIYPICGLKDIPSGVYLFPAAVLFFNMSVKSLYHSSSRVPRRVFPQEESPHRVRVSDHFGSLARVHLHFACSNHCILKNRVAFPFINGALRHRKIQTYAFMC